MLTTRYFTHCFCNRVNMASPSEKPATTLNQTKNKWLLKLNLSTPFNIKQKKKCNVFDSSKTPLLLSLLFCSIYTYHIAISRKNPTPWSRFSDTNLSGIPMPISSIHWFRHFLCLPSTVAISILFQDNHNLLSLAVISLVCDFRKQLLQSRCSNTSSESMCRWSGVNHLGQF